MATGEESDDESLGGAEMHARISGLADYFAVDEIDAIRLGRQIIAAQPPQARPRPARRRPPAEVRPRAAARHPVAPTRRCRSTRAT
jgi:acetyl-CoA carboxylase carboxyltransferase component